MSIAFAEQLKAIRIRQEQQERLLSEYEQRLQALETQADRLVDPSAEANGNGPAYKTPITIEGTPETGGRADDGEGSALSDRLSRAAGKRR